jgi:hypothetical protein
MFHMLTCFDLQPGLEIDEFRRALDGFSAHMQERELVHSTGPIGRRQRHPVMDTDSERNHEYFFVMSFRDRAQCDRAVEYIYAHEEPAESIHTGVYTKVMDPIFICWEDL